MKKPQYITLLEDMIKGIVENEDQVVVNYMELEVGDGMGTLQELKPGVNIEIGVAQDDMPLLIGKQGVTIKAISHLVFSSASKNGRYAKVHVRENVR